jgi:ribosomal protein L37AE/L43A
MLDTLKNPHIIKEYLMLGKVQHVKYECEWCGKLVVRKMSKLKNRIRQHLFCGVSCSGRFNSQTRSLEKRMVGIYD